MSVKLLNADITSKDYLCFIMCHNYAFDVIMSLIVFAFIYLQVVIGILIILIWSSEWYNHADQQARLVIGLVTTLVCQFLVIVFRMRL